MKSSMINSWGSDSNKTEYKQKVDVVELEPITQEKMINDDLIVSTKTDDDYIMNFLRSISHF